MSTTAHSSVKVSLRMRLTHSRALHVCGTCAGVSVVICSMCNLATPILSGILFEILTGRQPMARYPYFLGLMATLYTVEPLLTRVYIQNVCLAGEKVGYP